MPVGRRAVVRIVVEEGDTAVRVGSGDVPVLATPRLLALAEAASVAAIAPHLAEGTTSVGTAASLEHKRASPVGAEVVVEAELTGVDGRRLVFSFVARQRRPRPQAGDADAVSPPPARDGGADPDVVPPAQAGGGEADSDVVVGAGTVERVVVDRAKFLAQVAAQSK